MGPRAALAAGIAAGVVIVLLVGAAMLVLARGGTATVTLPPIPVPTLAPTGSTAPGASGSGPAASADATAMPAPTGPGGSTVPAGPGGSTVPGASGASPSPPDITDALFGVSHPAPPLQVGQLGGGTVDLAALRGHPVWVAFTATSSPASHDEYVAMESFALRYAYTGLVVVAVHEKDDPATVQALVDSLGITFPVGLDASGTAARDWRVVALPMHFWVDADGIVRDGAFGGAGLDAMAAGLRSVLPGVDVTPSASPTPAPATPMPASGPTSGASPLPVVSPSEKPTPSPS